MAKRYVNPLVPRSDAKVENSGFKKEVINDYLSWMSMQAIAAKYAPQIDGGLSFSAVQRFVTKEGLQKRRKDNKRYVLETIVEMGISDMNEGNFKVEAKDVLNSIKLMAAIDGDIQSPSTNIQIVNTPSQDQFNERLKTSNRLRVNILDGKNEE